MIRVLVAEDSPTVRQLLIAILTSDPDMRVVGEAANGAEAVALARALRPDVITMDIHMPILDGFEATKAIMSEAPVPIVIVSRRATRDDVELSLDATSAGALIVLRTPDSPGTPAFEAQRIEFLTMVRAMSAVKVVRRRSRAAWAPRGLSAPARARDARVIAIAASTGGPAALHQILSALPRDFATPIVIVQHIARGFVSGLADWLGRGCKLRVKLAQDGESLSARTVYLAPDQAQVGVTATSRIALSNAAPIGDFQPSATHLFSTAAMSFGKGVVAVILTGMGRDGVDGLRDVKAAGGFVIAQDEATSVVFGMPGEAVRAGVVDEVVPVHAIAARLTGILYGALHG